jgi:uncharacterized membrane-anchored protein
LLQRRDHGGFTQGVKRGNRGVAGITGTLRVDARASRLAPRLHPGDIAVLDQVDLDGATAQVLLSRGVAAVVNAAPSTSGRYPNLGPALLVGAGVPLLDDVGMGVLTALRDGSAARVDGDTLWVDDTEVARGMRQDAESVALASTHARGGVAAQLADLAGGAVGFLLEERCLLLDGTGLPTLRTEVRSRHALLVGPSYGGKADLASLKRYRKRHRPLLVGVDGGVDLLLAAGLRPDLAVGDPETMSDQALRAARELVLRADGDGWDRVHELSVPAHACRTRAAPEDLALLLLHHGEAALVVAVGLPRDLEELLDRGRAAAASSLVSRMAGGGRLLQAEAAHALVRRRSWGLPVLCLLLAAGLAGSVALGHAELLDAWHRFAG